MGLETVHVIWAWNHIEANVAETFLVKTIAQTVGIFNAVQSYTLFSDNRSEAIWFIVFNFTECWVGFDFVPAGFTSGSLAQIIILINQKYLLYGAWSQILV